MSGKPGVRQRSCHETGGFLDGAVPLPSPSCSNICGAVTRLSLPQALVPDRRKEGAALLSGGKHRWVRPQVATHERHSDIEDIAVDLAPLEPCPGILQGIGHIDPA